MPRWPNATAIARPKRRPAPVTNAVLRDGVPLLPERGDDVIGERRSAGGERDGPVGANGVHGALNAASVRLKRVIRARELAVRVAEQRERQAQVARIALVALDARRIHA